MLKVPKIKKSQSKSKSVAVKVRPQRKNDFNSVEEYMKNLTKQDIVQFYKDLEKIRRNPPPPSPKKDKFHYIIIDIICLIHDPKSKKMASELKKLMDLFLIRQGQKGGTLELYKSDPEPESESESKSDLNYRKWICLWCTIFWLTYCIVSTIDLVKESGQRIQEVVGDIQTIVGPQMGEEMEKAVMDVGVDVVERLELAISDPIQLTIIHELEEQLIPYISSSSERDSQAVAISSRGFLDILDDKFETDIIFQTSPVPRLCETMWDCLPRILEMAFYKMREEAGIASDPGKMAEINAALHEIKQTADEIFNDSFGGLTTSQSELESKFPALKKLRDQLGEPAHLYMLDSLKKTIMGSPGGIPQGRIGLQIMTDIPYELIEGFNKVLKKQKKKLNIVTDIGFANAIAMYQNIKYILQCSILLGPLLFLEVRRMWQQRPRSPTTKQLNPLLEYAKKQPKRSKKTKPKPKKSKPKKSKPKKSKPKKSKPKPKKTNHKKRATNLRSKRIRRIRRIRSKRKIMSGGGSRSPSPSPKKAKFSPPPPADAMQVPLPAMQVPLPTAPAAAAAPHKWLYVIEKEFEYIKELGKGSFGEVALFRDGKTEFAIKKIEKDGLNHIEKKRTLREIIILKKLQHPNIVESPGVLGELSDSGQLRNIYIIMMAGGYDLHRYMESGSIEDENMILNIMHQLFCGLQYIHSANIVHRDLKPDNLLISRLPDGRITLKICDFGMSRYYISQEVWSAMIEEEAEGLRESRDAAITLMKISGTSEQDLTKVPSEKEFVMTSKGTSGAAGGDAGGAASHGGIGEVMSGYVTTRWYRAPEVLLRQVLKMEELGISDIDRRYGFSVDIWAAGCIMGELYNKEQTGRHKPIFPGMPTKKFTGSENQIIRIIQVAGIELKPGINCENIQEIVSANQIAKFPKTPLGGHPTRLFVKMGITPAAVQLLNHTLEFNVEDRPSTKECVEHTCFQTARKINPCIEDPKASTLFGDDDFLFEGELGFDYDEALKEEVDL